MLPAEFNSNAAYITLHMRLISPLGYTLFQKVE